MFSFYLRLGFFLWVFDVWVSKEGFFQGVKNRNGSHGMTTGSRVVGPEATDGSFAKLFFFSESCLTQTMKLFNFRDYIFSKK